MRRRWNTAIPQNFPLGGYSLWLSPDSKGASAKKNCTSCRGTLITVLAATVTSSRFAAAFNYRCPMSHRFDEWQTLPLHRGPWDWAVRMVVVQHFSCSLSARIFLCRWRCGLLEFMPLGKLDCWWVIFSGGLVFWGCVPLVACFWAPCPLVLVVVQMTPDAVLYSRASLALSALPQLQTWARRAQIAARWGKKSLAVRAAVSTGSCWPSWCNVPIMAHSRQAATRCRWDEPKKTTKGPKEAFSCSQRENGPLWGGGPGAIPPQIVSHFFLFQTLYGTELAAPYLLWMAGRLGCRCPTIWLAGPSLWRSGWLCVWWATTPTAIHGRWSGET